MHNFHGATVIILNGKQLKSIVKTVQNKTEYIYVLTKTLSNISLFSDKIQGVPQNMPHFGFETFVFKYRAQNKVHNTLRIVSPVQK